MSLSDHIVFWARHAQVPELKPDQYIWFGKKGSRGMIRNRKSLSAAVLADPAVRAQFNLAVKAAFSQESSFFKVLDR